MGRPRRAAAGGMVYHVLNRANARLRIFFDDRDYAAFEAVMAEGVERTGMRVLAYALMPNHWHVVLWPRRDGDLSRFAGWVALTHTQRWHARRHNAGSGHLYQGRFKSFPVQDDRHLGIVCRYVERNPLRAGLVGRAEAWRWSSLWRVVNGAAAAGGGGTGGPAGAAAPPLTTDGPLERGRGWVGLVNAAQTAAEREDAAVRLSVARGRPFGDPAWQARTARRLGLGSTMRDRGRPRKAGEAGGAA